jgi:hypothetical protein
LGILAMDLASLSMPLAKALGHNGDKPNPKRQAKQCPHSLSISQMSEEIEGL